MSDDSSTDWPQLREFAGVDLAQSFVLSWHTELETLMIDVDLFLTPEHPFYEKPRPAEKICIRPAIIEFPICDSITVNGVGGPGIAKIADSIGPGRIEGLRRYDEGRYEITGPFGKVAVAAERPLLKLKGP